MIVAVVPVKRLRDCKSRLATILSQAERAQLCLDLAEHVIGVLRDSLIPQHVAVATPEPDVGARLSNHVLHDRGGLNSSLALGTRWAAELGATGLIIAPADLPCVTEADVRALVEASESTPHVVIARGQRGGTGALLLAPPDAIRPSFGEDSFARHVRLAEEAGIEPSVVNSPGFCFDLDLPMDLDALRARGRRP